MKIAIFMPDLRGGGAERVNINLANALASRGYAVDLVLMVAKGELLPLLDPAVRLVDLGAPRVRNGVRPLAQYLRDARPASLLACMWPLPIMALLAKLAARSRTRIVAVEHTTWSTAVERGSVLHRIALATTMRLAYRWADAVVAVSRGAADDLASLAGLPRDRVTAIYNPIVGGSGFGSPDQTTPPASWADGDHKKVLAVGTLTAIKDYPTLLRAFALSRRQVDAKLLILGEGKERNALEQLIADLDLSRHVFLTGFVADPAPYYHRADLHVLSSVGEGLPTVIVEALEAGTPVVSTDCKSGPREILSDGRYGILVPVGDAGALANAMVEALGRQHDTEALQARAADFSIDKAVDAYLELFLPNTDKALAT